MTRKYWWESGEYTIEGEEKAFRDAGLAFELDRELFARHRVVVFRGHLRQGKRRIPAEVRYPPSYGEDEPVVLIATSLPIGRHRNPDGIVCLDHPVNGAMQPMGGACAVLRAERLWWLWENDRAQLHAEEADAPDPRANYYDHDRETAITLTDVDVTSMEDGHLGLRVGSLRPFRGAVIHVQAREPRDVEVDVPAERIVLAGQLGIVGSWRRVASAPEGFTAQEVHAWARRAHPDLIGTAVSLRDANFMRSRFRDIPAVTGFVYPDEGPGRAEWHDAWLFLLIGPTGPPELPRPFVLRTEERWLRQPQFQPLAAKRVGIVGVGALGSPVAAHLARAGVGRFVLIDHDIVSIGNRVRHELDLADLGRPKVRAAAERLRRINPWIEEVSLQPYRFGAATNGPSAEKVQELDDLMAQDLAHCDLIINTSAHSPTGYHCARLGRASTTPVLHAWVSAGAWGGRILVQGEGSGCSLCLAHAQEEPVFGMGTPPGVADDPDVATVLERGCADPSFTGPGFELADAAAVTARTAVQVLFEGSGYPERDFDLITLNFRSRMVARRQAHYTRLPVHPSCTICRGV